MAYCSQCGEFTKDYTWLRQRTLCRTCWEIKCHDDLVVTVRHGSNLKTQMTFANNQEEEE